MRINCKNYDSWLIGCIKKRTPDAIRILMDLLEAGLRNGEVSANDIADRNYVQPNVIGCTMKIIAKFGFNHTDRRIKTTAKKKHARRVDVWVLEHRWKAEMALAHMQHSILNYEPTGQMGLML